MSREQVYFVSGVRTAIGVFGGSLRDYSPGQLATAVAQESLLRSGLAIDTVGHVVFGQVIPTEPADAYLARVAALGAGLSVNTPALTVNRLCGSGLQAIISAAQHIMLGDTGAALAGGAESMSRAPFLATQQRWGKRMGDAQLVDALQGALTDPFERILMGVTAENVAHKYAITRQDQDLCAWQSQQRARHAIEAGYFTEQILPLASKHTAQGHEFHTDEHVRSEVTLEELGRLKPLFKKEAGTVTAGNASGINDGAAALVLCNERVLKEQDLRPMARLVAYAHSGVEPKFMGMGPVQASRLCLAKSGLNLHDLAVIESNEAFAAQACAVSQELGLDADKVNPNGSGIALGHPVGATGAINTVKLIYELQRQQARYGLVTMCIGGGQGIAMIIERC